ncbi:MAG: type II secretion system F family protein, partial [Deltaproteobacteria bacterium]|nr:type II secretion system F family protein [Deltaproteobacteria bacterium]
MPKFQYRARDAQGILITGELDALSANELREHLADQGLIPLLVKPSSFSLENTFLRKLLQSRVSGTELIVFTRQFYTLFKAGMGMESLLTTLARQTSNKRLKESLQRIRGSISSGEGLSKAFSHHTDIFGDLYTSMLAAGEEAGILEEVLSHLSKLLEKEMEIQSSVSSATLYPKIVVFVLVCATTVIMTVVVPKFATFFSHYQATLPLPTRMLM